MTKEPALEGLEQLLAPEPLDVRGTPILGRDLRVVVERGVRAFQRVFELVALENVVVGVRLLAPPVLRIDGAADRPQCAGLSLDPDHHALGNAGVIDAFEHALGKNRALLRPAAFQDLAGLLGSGLAEPRAKPAPPLKRHRKRCLARGFTPRTLARRAHRIETVVRLRSFLQNPFSFLFTGSSKEERIAAYVIREHDRGRRLSEILEDPYIRNRATERELARLLERPEVIEALGRGTVSEAQERLD